MKWVFSLTYKRSKFSFDVNIQFVKQKEEKIKKKEIKELNKNERVAFLLLKYIFEFERQIKNMNKKLISSYVLKLMMQYIFKEKNYE